MLDLDSFKQVNDTYGHKTGDRVLREVARILQAQLREYDFLARYAGDEFVAIVQDLTTEQVNELRERIEQAVSKFSLHVRGDKHARVGISVGAASYGVHGETLDQLLIAADEAMYSAKSYHKQHALTREAHRRRQREHVATSLRRHKLKAGIVIVNRDRKVWFFLSGLRFTIHGFLDFPPPVRFQSIKASRRGPLVCGGEAGALRLREHSEARAAGLPQAPS